MVTERLRNELEDLRVEFSIETLGLFGSVRNETQLQMSDVDLVVEFSQVIGLTFVELAEYQE